MFGEIRNEHGERLDYTFCPGAPARRDVVVIGHGVTANKDRPWAKALADGLGAAGIPALRLSFSGNGASDGEFTESTIHKEVADLGAVLDALSGWRVCYAGHSMGGAVGVLRASRDERIEALVSLAGMVHTAEFARRKFGGQQPGVSFMWDKPECPLSQEFLDDMARIESVVELGAEIPLPWLLVHGTADEVVPLQDSLDILARAGNDAELCRLDGVDHVFSEGGAEAMTGRVVAWVQARFCR